MTAEELLGLPDDGRRYELIEGELHMMSPAGFEHGRIAVRVASLLDQHVRANGLGAVCGAETGFLLSRAPDTVRAPDAAFVAKRRLEQLGDRQGYLELGPDLAVEVVSPGDSFTEVDQKARAWLSAGSRLVLVADPTARAVHLYRSPETVTILREGDTLEAGEVVPGWRLPVRELFA